MNECKHDNLKTEWSAITSGYTIKHCLDCNRILCTYKSLDGNEYNVSSAISERKALRAELDAVKAALESVIDTFGDGCDFDMDTGRAYCGQSYEGKPCEVCKANLLLWQIENEEQDA